MATQLKLVLFLVFCISSCSILNRKVNADQTPILVFVHGAHMNASSWNLLMSSLSDISTTTVNLQGRESLEDYSKITLSSTTKHFCKSIREVQDPKILIAHSQGGAIVNQSLAECSTEEVKSILYIASVIPFPKERAFDLLSKEDEKNYFKGIHYRKDRSVFEIKNKLEYLNTFAPRSNSEQKKIILKNSVNEPSKIGNEWLSFEINRPREIPKYYIQTLEDKIISLKSQKKTISRLKFQKIYQIKSGHLPMITHPEKTAKIIRDVLSN